MEANEVTRLMKEPNTHHRAELKEWKSRASSKPIQHYNWLPKDNDRLTQWCDRDESSGRPKTYDKFYRKTPGNFHPCLNDSGAAARRKDSRKETSSQISGEVVSLTSPPGATEQHRKDTILPGARRTTHRKVGRNPTSSDRIQGEDEEVGEGGQHQRRSRTLTERDVRRLERQLSMKKTIRKKMMRELRQAFVDDGEKGERAGKFKELSPSGGELKIKFDHPAEGGRTLLLDMLRGDSGSDDSGIGDEGRGNKRQFHSVGKATQKWSKGNELRGEDFDATAALESMKLRNLSTMEADNCDLEDARKPKVLVEMGADSRSSKRSFWHFFKEKKKTTNPVLNNVK